MCHQCGTFFFVEYQPDGPYRVVKSTEFSRVIIDEFAGELEAALFATQLHDDKLRAGNFYKRFRECSQL